jgi:hypothetical protein
MSFAPLVPAAFKRHHRTKCNLIFYKLHIIINGKSGTNYTTWRIDDGINLYLFLSPNIKSCIIKTFAELVVAAPPPHTHTIPFATNKNNSAL